MKVLYHGTRYLNSILASERLRPATIGDNVSLTTRKHVAKYFSELPRDNVFGFGYIMSLDRDLLEKDGYAFRPLEPDMVMIEEHELACESPIFPIGRYVIRIERVPGSYMGLHEVLKVSPGYAKIHYKRLLKEYEGSWASPSASLLL